MAIKRTDFVFNFRDIPNVHKHWGWFFALGILLMILGILAIGFAKWATEFTVIFLGCLLIGAGILQTFNGLYAIKWAGFSFSLLLGLLYIVAGALCIFKPLLSAESISLLIAALLLIGGIFRLVSAVRYRFDRWGWVVFNGIAAIFLGILILAEWPASAFWVIGFFVGIDLLLLGCYWTWMSLAVRKS